MKRTRTVILINLMLSIFLVSLTTSIRAASDLTPDQALAKLKQGNARYVAGNRQYPNLNQSRRNLTSTKGQHPFATIIGCSDSRVPIEHVFDVGIGDIFPIRVAGNVCDVDEVGSITFKELGKSLGVPEGQATRWARDLEKVGVLKIKGTKVTSTLKDVKIEEGEVK